MRAVPIPEAASGDYRLTLGELRPERPEDPLQRQAEAALNAAWRRLYAPAAGAPPGDLAALAAGCQAALERFREWGDRARQAEALALLGRLERQRADNRAALAALLPALALAREEGDRPLAADLENQIGLAHAALGETEEALSAYRASLALWRELQDERQEARLLNNLAMVELQSGETQGARERLEQVLAIFRRLGDRDQELAALNNLGGLYDSLGEPLLARDFYQRSLALARERGRRADEANARNNLGVSASRLGETREALEDYTAALALFRDLGDRRREASALNNLGELFLDLGAPERAKEPLAQSLAIARAVADPVREAAALLNLSRATADLGKLGEAEALLDQALALERRAGHRDGEAWTLRRQGWVRNLAGRPAQAVAPLKQALALFTELGDRTGETAVHQELGRAQAALGERAAARASFREALDLATAGGDLAARAAALEEIARLEAAGGDLAAARDHLETALADLESLRAQVAGDPLRIAHFAAVRSAYELAVNVLMQLHRSAPGAGWDVRAFEEAERGRARGLLDLLRQAGVAPRRTDPAWAGLSAPLPEARRIESGLDRETLLLEYSLGEPRSYLWAVTEDGLAGFALPGRRRIEALARRAHALVSRLDPGDRAAQEETLASLGRLLLGPVAGRLRGKRLAIVADGALEYLPFAALPEPGGTGEPLLVRHEIVRLPGAAVLAELRRTAASRPPAPGTVAILADPLFASEDRGERGERENVPLPGSRREAETIATIAGTAAGDRGPGVLLALGAEASRALALGPELARYRIVHFATHGVLDSRSPELSGLVLAERDAAGHPQEGFLSLADVYRLDLAADLVVLSGCRTALGAAVRGEGLVGLTRGFLQAGASRVLASLWPVRDQATAELMARFYRALLRDGLPPAAALRQAQRGLRERPQWRDPYYWSAFVLQGDWRAAAGARGEAR